MSDCRRIAERLPSYADKALPPEEQVEVQRHLDTCSPCRTAATQEEGGRSVLRARAGDLKAQPLPPGLRTRCEALARDHTAPPVRASWRSRLVPVSISAVFVLFTVLAIFSLATHRSDTLLAAQLTADHSKCFTLFASPDSADADAGAVEQMLSDTYGWDVHVPPSSPEDGVRLIGARRCLYADGRVPHVMYRVKDQDVSLYVLEGVTRTPAQVTTLGHRARIWSRGPTTYVLVAPDAAGDLGRAADYVMQEAH
jgi:anti-sigma factor RsiW